MTIEQTIASVLSPLVSNRVYPRGTVLQGTPRPFITYMSVGGRPVPALCGGGANKRNNVFQIDIWCDPPPVGDGIEQAVALLRAAEALLTASPIYGWPQNGGYDTFQDFETNTSGVFQTISFWWTP